MSWNCFCLYDFQIFYPHVTPTKIIKAKERTMRKAEKERDTLKLKQSTNLPTVNEKRYHKNMFR